MSLGSIEIKLVLVMNVSTENILSLVFKNIFIVFKHSLNIHLIKHWEIKALKTYKDEIEKRDFPTDDYSYDMGNDINDSLKEWKKEIKKILS